MRRTASHQTDPASVPHGPPAYPPSSPEASPHTVEAYSMPPLAPLCSAAMPWRPAHGGCGADPEGARPTAAVPTQMTNTETIAALSGQPGWPWRLVPCRTAGGTPSRASPPGTREYYLKVRYPESYPGFLRSPPARTLGRLVRTGWVPLGSTRSDLSTKRCYLIPPNRD